MRSFATLLLLAASSLAYQVDVPSSAAGWTNEGSQPLTWERVATDPLNFTAVLTNKDRSVNQVLSALVDGSLLNTTLNPPSAGWPLGGPYQLNLVQDPDHLDTIYAQSSPFNISVPKTSTTTGATTLPNSASTLVIQNTNTPTQPASVSATTDGANAPPTPSSAALPSVNVQGGLLGALAALSFFLA